MIDIKPSHELIAEMMSLLQARLWIRLKRWRARGRGEPRSRWTTRRTKTDRTSPRLWAACSPVFRPWRAPNASPIPSGRSSPVTPVSRWIEIVFCATYVCRRGEARVPSPPIDHILVTTIDRRRFANARTIVSKSRDHPYISLRRIK